MKGKSIMNNTRYQNENDLPITLNIDDVAKALGISRELSQQIMFSDNFPSLRFGDEALIKRDSFLRWLEKEDANVSKPRNSTKKLTPYKSAEEFPMTMDCEDIARALNISKSTVYRLTRTRDFPTLQIGRKKLVNREKFFEWLENQELPLF